MIANIFGIKVDVIESEEGPAMGGAMLAAVPAANTRMWWRLPKAS